MAKHRIYLEALKSAGVNVILCNFHQKDVICRGTCRQTFTIPTEKETDVNIAIRLLEGAFKDEYEMAYIVSGDSDLLPAIQAVKRIFPAK